MAHGRRRCPRLPEMHPTGGSGMPNGLSPRRSFHEKHATREQGFLTQNIDVGVYNGYYLEQEMRSGHPFILVLFIYPDGEPELVRIDMDRGKEWTGKTVDSDWYPQSHRIFRISPCRPSHIMQMMGLIEKTNTSPDDEVSQQMFESRFRPGGLCNGDGS